jgi:hypothetical protein
MLVGAKLQICFNRPFQRFKPAVAVAAAGYPNEDFWQ